MPFKQNTMSMLLILPDPEEFLSFESDLSAEAIDTIAANLEPEYVVMTIPRFLINSSYDLKSTMIEMGLTDPFHMGADFSGIDGTDDGIPWISVLVHKARIWVNEYGASAMAGTGMVLTIGVHPSFSATRPFIYLIRDIETGTILFMGRVVAPNDPYWPIFPANS
jgi:serpin B